MPHAELIPNDPFSLFLGEKSVDRNSTNESSDCVRSRRRRHQLLAGVSGLLE